MLRNRLTDKIFLSRAIVIIIMILPAKKTYGQNCQVDFQGISSLNFSEICGGTVDDLNKDFGNRYNAGMEWNVNFK